MANNTVTRRGRGYKKTTNHSLAFPEVNRTRLDPNLQKISAEIIIENYEDQLNNNNILHETSSLSNDSSDRLSRPVANASNISKNNIYYLTGINEEQQNNGTEDNRQQRLKPGS